jgi:hypothetical protein
MKIDDLKPNLYTIEYSEVLVSNQGYSFDEAGQSFDEVGVMFGGLYGMEGNKPTIEVTDYKPL